MHSILVILGSLMVVVTQAQNYRGVDSRNAKILQEARYLQGGSHGAAYIQDDGTEFKEETDADGTRKGSYSYIDDTGKKITVQYTAGKNGFMVSGDHLPKAPQPLPVQPQQQYQAEPELPQQQQYQPNPRFNSVPQQQSPTGQFAYSFGGPTNNPQFSNNALSQFNNQFQQQQPQQYHFQPTTTTQAPQRHFAPGKLNLNRTPDGFQYSFSS